jgi:hypothetical protein
MGYGHPMVDTTTLLASGGVLFLVIYLVGSLIVLLIGIWISYSVIWHAVRRGLREYHKDSPTAPTP